MGYKFKKSKKKDKIISIFTIIKWNIQCGQLSLNLVVVQESFAGIVIAGGA